MRCASLKASLFLVTIPAADVFMSQHCWGGKIGQTQFRLYLSLTLQTTPVIFLLLT